MTGEAGPSGTANGKEPAAGSSADARSEVTQANGSNGEGEASTGGVSLERRFFNLRTAVSFVAAFAILYFVFTKIDVDLGDIVAGIRQANIGIFIVAFVVYYLSFPIRAWRWQLLLGNVGYSRGTGKAMPSLPGLGEIIMLSWFANCIVPAKLGDAYRGYLLKQRADVSFSRTMGTVLAERVMDMLVLFCLMGVAGLGVFGGHVPNTMAYLFVVGLALAVIVVVALLGMRHFGRHLERLLPHRVRGFYGRFEEGTLQSFRQMPLLIVLTVAVWVIEASRFWLVMAALGLFNVSPLVVIFTALAGSLLTTLPVTPGGLGLVETGVIGILLFVSSLGMVPGLTAGLAGSVALLDRSLSYWSIVAVGLVVYVVSRRK